jgi:hypothetical protein
MLLRGAAQSAIACLENSVEEKFMKRMRTVLATLSLVSLLAVPTAFAQPCMGRGCEDWGGQHQHMYNPKTVETISGEVTAIDTIMPNGRMSGGVHLRVRTQNNQIVPIHLGPAWYLDNQDIKIQVGDKVEVKGSKVVLSGQPTIIAAQLKRGDTPLESLRDRIFKLRDDKGFPVWSGRGRWH